ncbi:hypothetical protein LTR66_004505 [Elasticomyces elasticus]|nr:hypothetical protein LTR28_006279 [Elasticomyces elasticus]KAK4995738.1 hypothetical protein LTR66_004505 [Elasticomyces elasticus]
MLLQAIVICILAANPVHAAYFSESYPSLPSQLSNPSSGSHFASSTSAADNPAGTGIIVLPESPDWSGWGGNIYNNRWASKNSEISSSSVQSLVQHCKISYALGVSATPTLHSEIAYYPTWNGLLVALHYETCRVQWQINVTELIIGFAPLSLAQQLTSSPVSRTSPQIDGEVLYFGTLNHALLFAVDINTGTTLGSIQINPHPLAVLTMSPTVYNGLVLIGAASQEEVAAGTIPGYQCCSFVGNMAALAFDPSSGQFNVAWNISMLPDPPGNWSGAAIWGSQPSIDPGRSQVFIATGNIYSLPQEFETCQNQSLEIAVVAQGLTLDPCLPPNVLQESVIAIDIHSGLINWVNQLSPLDAWSVACSAGIAGVVISDSNRKNCPSTPGLDTDFGMAPTFVPGSAGTPFGKDTVVIGQKSGNLYAMSAQAGRVFWTTVTSPDGLTGGLIWGIAVDDTQVYFTAVNSYNIEWQLQPSNQTIRNSAFGSASLANGKLLWETQSLPSTSISFVPPSVVNDVVFVGRTGNNFSDAYVGTHGSLVLLDKHTGAVIRDIDLGVNFRGGITIQDQYVMFGSGSQGYTKGNGSFYVMSV